MEIEVRFGLACVGIEMEREMGKLLEQHTVPLQCQMKDGPAIN